MLCKRKRKKVKIQEFMYGDTTNVEPEMYDYTSNNWSQWNSNEKLKEEFGSWTRKTSDRFTTKDSYTWNITHNTESTAVWNLTSERCGSPLVQEKYQAEKACDKRHPYNNNNNNNNNNNLYWVLTGSSYRSCNGDKLCTWKERTDTRWSARPSVVACGMGR